MWSVPRRSSAALHRLADVRGAAVETHHLPVLDLPPELGRQDHLVALARERLAQELLVGEGPIDLGGVEEGDPQLQGPVEGGEGLDIVGGAVRLAHPHAAEAEGADRQSLGAEGAGLHGRSFRGRRWPQPYSRIVAGTARIAGETGTAAGAGAPAADVICSPSGGPHARPDPASQLRPRHRGRAAAAPQKRGASDRRVRGGTAGRSSISRRCPSRTAPASTSRTTTTWRSSIPRTRPGGPTSWTSWAPRSPSPTTTGNGPMSPAASPSTSPATPGGRCSTASRRSTPTPSPGWHRGSADC